MIANIIRQVYDCQLETVLKQLLEEPIICGSLFRSFDNFTQHLIFLMYANQGIISRAQIINSMKNSPYRAEGQQLFTQAIMNLDRIKVINRSSFDSLKISLNESFANKLNQFIVTPTKNFGEPHNLKNDDFFNLLLLLDQNNDIYRHCKIGNMRPDTPMTKQNFDFIRSPIGYKISILIKGYLKSIKNLKERRITLKNILLLSEMDCNNKYKMTSESAGLIYELEKMHLVKRVEGDYFVISPYLHNFAFEKKKNTKLLSCEIIIETNFKVYILIPKSQNVLNYQLISRIMDKLINIQHKDYQLQQLIVGEINNEKMNNIFMQKISVQDYLSFFLDYMSSGLQIEKDLGKWNKIKFLGLQGPENQKVIPNNVKQELKLWQAIVNNSNPTFYIQPEQRYHHDLYDLQ